MWRKLLDDLEGTGILCGKQRDEVDQKPAYRKPDNTEWFVGRPDIASLYGLVLALSPVFTNPFLHLAA
jgi:hypothetical protein